MPRSELINTQPVRVRIHNTDLARIDELYRYVGIHGHLSDVIRKGTRIQVFIEEVLRERIPAGEDVKAAIHTLQVAVDRRDRDIHDQGKKLASSTTKEKKSQDDNKDTKKSTGKKGSRKVRSVKTADS